VGDGGTALILLSYSYSSCYSFETPMIPEEYEYEEENEYE